MTLDDEVKYVGKGSETDGQDRVLCYFEENLTGATPYVRKKIQESRQRGETLGYLILEEVFVSENSSAEEINRLEDQIYELEATWIRRYGIDRLWNKTTGGKSGWKVTQTTRTMQSIGQRNRHRGNKASRAGLGHLLSDLEKVVPLQRTLRWTVTPDEGRALNLPAGLVQLSELQIKLLRDYRYQHAKKLN